MTKQFRKVNKSFYSAVALIVASGNMGLCAPVIENVAEKGPMDASAAAPDTSQAGNQNMLAPPLSVDSKSSAERSLMPNFDPAQFRVGTQSSFSEPTGQLQNTNADLTIDDVKIEGNRLVATEDILGVVKTRRGDKFNRDQVLKDLKAVNSMGYFDDRSLQVVPELTTGGVLLKIRVQENAPVTEFSFQGNQVLSSEEIAKIFADQLGKPQNLNELSSAIDIVERAYHEKGYILARITDVKDDPDGSIGITLNEGVIDKVEIVGNRRTKDFIVRNAVKLKPGCVYNERNLTADLRKLYANGYFQDIRRGLAPSATNPDKYTLKIEVAEKRTGSVGIGGGIDSIAGPFGSLSFSESNFRGRGQIVSFNSQVGSGLFGQINNAINNPGSAFLANRRTYQVEATFIEPNFRGTDTSIAVSGFGRNFNSLMIDQAQQRSIGASINLTKPIKGHLSLGLGLTGENTHLQDVASLFRSESILTSMANRALQTGSVTNTFAAQQLANRVRDSQLKGGTFLSINPSISYDTRDSIIDPHQGTMARVSAGPSLGLTGSAFAKLGASVSKYVPISKSTTLAMNIQGGTAVGGIPQFAQYRLGGWNGVRGYRAFSDLGTGTSMLMATAELRTKFPFLQNSNSKLLKAVDKHVKAAVFFDVGQTSGNSLVNNLLYRSQMGAAIGLGLRINMPMVGLIRLDYGLPLISSLLGKTTPRFSIGFGEKF